MATEDRLLAYFAAHDGEIVREADVRAALDISHGTFHRARAQLLESGQLTRRKVGQLYVYALPKGSAAGVIQAAKSPKIAHPTSLGEVSPSEVQELRDLSGQYGSLDEVQGEVLAFGQDMSYSLEGDRFIVESGDGLHKHIYEVSFYADFVQIDLLASE